MVKPHMSLLKKYLTQIIKRHYLSGPSNARTLTQTASCSIKGVPLTENKFSLITFLKEFTTSFKTV